MSVLGVCLFCVVLCSQSARRRPATFSDDTFRTFPPKSFVPTQRDFHDSERCCRRAAGASLARLASGPDLMAHDGRLTHFELSRVPFKPRFIHFLSHAANYGDFCHLTRAT